MKIDRSLYLKLLHKIYFPKLSRQALLKVLFQQCLICSVWIAGFINAVTFVSAILTDDILVIMGREINGVPYLGTGMCNVLYGSPYLCNRGA